MNTDRMRMWVDALRSGEYQQGQGYLNKNDKLCCLGVLCEVSIKDGLDLHKEIRDHRHDDSPVWNYGGQPTYPPVEVMKWLGLENDIDVRVTHKVSEDKYVEQASLIAMNDSFGWTFGEIADGLEANYLGEKVAA